MRDGAPGSTEWKHTWEDPMAAKGIYAPKSPENPWRVEDGKTVEVWYTFALWYPYSVRTLLTDGRRYELARCSNYDSASQVIKGLTKQQQSAFGCYILVQCIRLGKEGREKVMQYAPSKRHVQAALMQIQGKKVKLLSPAPQLYTGEDREGQQEKLHSIQSGRSQAL